MSFNTHTITVALRSKDAARVDCASGFRADQTMRRWCFAEVCQDLCASCRVVLRAILEILNSQVRQTIGWCFDNLPLHVSVCSKFLFAFETLLYAELAFWNVECAYHCWMNAVRSPVQEGCCPNSVASEAFLQSWFNALLGCFFVRRFFNVQPSNIRLWSLFFCRIWSKVKANAYG